MKLHELSPAQVLEALRGAGLALRIAPVVVRVQSPLREFAARLHALYRDYEVVDTHGYADIAVRLLPGRGVRRVVRPTVLFVVDGVAPFEPFPRDHAMPLFEWGVNWVFAHRMHQFLLLHAAVVERGGRAVVLPAWPGAGKSTLAASLACAGWRFLSDEFGVVTQDGLAYPFARPAALKNESIAVMRELAFDRIGPVYPRTRKGAVAHFRVPEASLAAGDTPARIAAVVFPDFAAGASLAVQTMSPTVAFLKLAHNAFNYEVVGERGFATVTRIVRTAPACIVRYGHLDAAHRVLDDLLARDAA